MTNFNMNRAFQPKSKLVSINSCFLFVTVSHQWPAELLSQLLLYSSFSFLASLLPSGTTALLKAQLWQECFGAWLSELCKFSLWLSAGECRYGRGRGEKQAVRMILISHYLWQNLTFVSTYAQVSVECVWLCCTKACRKEWEIKCLLRYVKLTDFKMVK